MYLIMENKEVQVFAEQYFASQNFLNKKILQDISSVRDRFPIEKWEKLTFSDREKVKYYFSHQDVFLVHPCMLFENDF